MSHRTKGLYRILERPAAYEFVQKMLGARGARTRFVREFLRPFDGARLLDVGCGTASLLEYLPAGVDYTGFDMNPAYIAAARKKYGDRGRFFVARAGEEGSGTTVDGPFDFVVAKGLLHHLGDDEAHALLAAARGWLREDGVFVSLDNACHSSQRRISRLLISLDRGGSVRTPEAYRALAEAHFSRVESWLLTDMIPIPYDHFVMRAGAREA